MRVGPRVLARSVWKVLLRDWRTAVTASGGSVRKLRLITACAAAAVRKTSVFFETSLLIPWSQRDSLPGSRVLTYLAAAWEVLRLRAEECLDLLRGPHGRRSHTMSLSHRHERLHTKDTPQP